MTRTLWRHADFLRLWSAETISQLGSQMTLLALPLVAISVLRADAFQLGLLGAAEFLPFVVLGLPAGAWIDRLRRRPVLIAADLGRAVALGSIPLAYAAGALSIEQLYAVAFVVGSLTVFFDVAYEAFVPALVGRELLVDGNSKLEMSRSGATVAGPTLAGPLVSLLSAPFALLTDAASFVASAILIFSIRSRDRIASAEHGTRAGATMWRDIKEGFRYVARQRFLRSIAACTATSNLFLSMAGAVLLMYLIREVGLSAAQVGLVFGVGNVGFLVGAIANERVTARIGIGPAIVVAMAIGGAAGFLVPAAPRSLAPFFVALAQFLSGFSTTLYNINQVSLRQLLAPERLRGRINATMRFVVWGTIPLGTIAGGALASAIGIRPTLWIAAVGGATAFLWILLSPVAALAQMPAPDRDDGLAQLAANGDLETATAAVQRS